MITRPYDEDDLPTYEDIHAGVRPLVIRPEELRPTQPMLDLDRLLAVARGEPAEGPDPHLHVVCHQGALWVHDGHHRWVAALLGGERTVTARVVWL